MNARYVSALGSLAAVLLTASACVKYYDVSVETPIRAHIDVSDFDRVLVAGFIAGGTNDLDSNLETTRLLRSQLRTRSTLRVIEADVLPLMEVAKAPAGGGNGTGGNWGQVTGNGSITSERDLDAFKHVFTDTDYWRRVGEEHQQPLIVTGTILFTPQESSQVVSTQRESFDDLGRRSSEPTQELRERRGFILQPDFIFIDGRTGTVMHTESFNESILYAATNPTPALSSYFELMDRVLPGFLSTFSSQTIRGTRVLLR